MISVKQEILYSTFIMKRMYLFLVLTHLLGMACQKKETVHPGQHPRPVKGVQVKNLGTITRQYTGVVEATEFSTLAFKVPGTLEELRFSTGQQVRQGEIIARIKPFDYNQQYRTAEANYQLAKSIYERNKRLFASNAVSRQNLEIAEADYVKAESALNIAQRTLGYTVLTAPFNGFVEQRYVENYEEITAGQAILRLVNPDSIEVRFTLPETNISLLTLPQKIFIEFDSRKGKLFASDIKEYIYSSDGGGIPVTLNITDQSFLPYRPYVFPGFSCKVIFEIDSMVSDKFLIPGSALFQENDKYYVWIIRPATFSAHKQQVDVSFYGNQAFVSKGLSKDDRIVIAGISALHEGQKVKPINI